MNQKEIEQRRNENARKLVRDDRFKRNFLDIHQQNSKKHEKKKFEICWQLKKEGKEFITEARFKDRNIRADIFCLDTGEIYEVETSTENLEDRKSEYPEDKLNVVELDEN